MIYIFKIVYFENEALYEKEIILYFRLIYFGMRTHLPAYTTIYHVSCTYDSIGQRIIE